MRAIRIHVDGIQVGKLEPGQDSMTIELDDAPHLLHASVPPFYYSRKRAVNEVSDVNMHYHVGIFYSNVFQGFMPSAMKILSESEYEDIKCQKRVLPRLSVFNLWTVIVSGVLAGMLLIYASRNGNLDADYQSLISLVGWAAAIGGISVYLFNRPTTDSTFPYHKPFLDAGALVFLAILLDPADSLFLFSCFGIGLLLIIGVMNLRRTRK